MQSFISPVNSLLSMGQKVQEMAGDLNRLDDVLRYRTHTAIEVKNVWRRGNNGDRLEGFWSCAISLSATATGIAAGAGFNLRMKPGPAYALVGGSGSGKSTVSKIVAGLYDRGPGKCCSTARAANRCRRWIVNNSLAMVDQGYCAVRRDDPPEPDSLG